jgi:glycerol-3-phosphate acyltransferase PlsY
MFIEKGKYVMGHIHNTFLSNHLNGKTRSWKIGLIASVLTKELDTIIITWTLIMQIATYQISYSSIENESC